MDSSVVAAEGTTNINLRERANVEMTRTYQRVRQHWGHTELGKPLELIKTPSEKARRKETGGWLHGLLACLDLETLVRAQRTYSTLTFLFESQGELSKQ